jgi:pantoate--beta-alanine ligase
LKDAQQFFVLSKMVKDLHLDIQVKGIPTVRETDGLALSSRNVYLSPGEREIAPQIYQVLKNLKDAASLGSLDQRFLDALSQAKSDLTERGFQVQYLDCLVLPEFQLLKETIPPEKPALIAVAAYLGKTRLIDNILIHPEKLDVLQN